MKRVLSIVPDPSFSKKVERESGVVFSACFQCKKCTNGCLFTFAMDYYPDEIIRLVQLGIKEVLSSATIWVCAACETCVTRCPNEVDIPKLMDYLKQMALKQGILLSPKEQRIAAMHQVFLSEIKKWGRIYELELMFLHKLKTKTLFEDIDLGWEMIKRGKLKWLPTKIKGLPEIKKIFKKAQK